VRLIGRAVDIDFAWLEGAKTVGITAGASAPEVLVDEVIAAARQHRTVTIREIRVTEETVTFKLPKALVG
jgi:4-hydroxy-3-methylbut-2-enyl diphosphate reductase